MTDSLRNFEWKDIGDIALGRPNLGEKMNVAAYRMFQYSLRSVLEKEYGKDMVKHILVQAGRVSGIEFCMNLLCVTLPADRFFSLLHKKLEELGIGILTVVHADLENLVFILSVSEDLDCSGLPVTGEVVCNYDEGFIMGILEMYTGKQFMVKETDCWTTGNWTCSFNIVAI